MRSPIRTRIGAPIAVALVVTTLSVGLVAAQSPSAPAPQATPIVAASPTPAPPATPTAPTSPTAEPAATLSAADPRLAAAVEATVASGTVRTTYSVVFNGSSTIPDGTTISGDGQMTLGLERRMRLAADMTALGVGAFDLIVDGTMLYIRGLPIGQVSPDQWVSADLTRDDPMTQSLKGLASGNNDASLLLYFFLGALGPAEVLGEESIDGVATTRLGATLSLDRALELVPEDIRPTLETTIAEARQGGVDPTLGAQAWVDADDLVHRVVLEYALGDAMGGGGMTVTFDFRQHGQPLDLGIPAPEEIVDIATMGG